MSKIVNLRDDKPLLMNVENISVITENRQDHGEGHQTTLSFSDMTQGHFLQIGEDWGVTAVEAVTKIRKAGLGLFELPLYWGDNKQTGNYYINPALVQSIISSDPRQENGDNYESVYLLVDVKGYGRVETTKVPVALVEGLIKDVEKHVPHMLRFESGTYRTRFHGDKGFTMFDPREVRSIQPNGYDLDIKFKDGMRIDFTLDPHNTIAGTGRAYQNKLLKKIMGQNTDIKALMEKLDGDLNSLNPRAAKYEERQRQKLREKFAAAVAPHVPGLIEIKNTDSVYYVRPESISWISQHDESLSVHFKQQADQQRADNMPVYFRDKDTAKAAQEQLVQAINNAAPQP